MRLWVVLIAAGCAAFAQTQDRLVFPGGKGAGAGKRIVLVSGDDEYRSEQALPELAKILSLRQGFDTTVLFEIDPATGEIAPDQHHNIPGLETLDTADLVVLLIRFRDLPDAQMKHIVDYVEAGKPIVALRTATHGFDLKSSPTYRRWSWNSKEWDGGFGRQVLGETWIDHHGRHKVQSTRAMTAPGQAGNPILRGIADGAIWVPTDVYRVRLPMAPGIQPLLMGAVLESMDPDSAPVKGPQNDPMMPVAWTKEYRGGRVFTTTMGSAQDMLNEGFRRLVVNACYWALGMDVPQKADVRIAGPYQPLPFGFGGYRKGLRVADLER
ncbi:MAG: ThuA domain-containing protein [Acidobacteriota bacterium]|nr:ThuA domain-containing protein [Acidobacteriota bacterium]